MHAARKQGKDYMLRQKGQQAPHCRVDRQQVFGRTRCYSIDGKDSISDQHDLFMAEERREAWIKLLCDTSGNHKIVDKLYKTKAEAEADNYLGCVANILIKWEE